MTNGEKFKEVFGYEPATDAVVCNKEDWCGASEPCNYCISNPNNIGREEDWWNAEYEPTTKNDSGVDLISRSDVLKLMQDNWHTHNGDWAMQESMDDIRALPSVIPQEPQSFKWCTEKEQ